MKNDKNKIRIYWFLMFCGIFFAAGIYWEFREKNAVTISNIQWKLIQIGVCQVSFTVTNTSQTHLQMDAIILVFIENRKRTEHSGVIIFYEEVGQRSIQIQLQPNQSQDFTYPVTILSLSPLSIAKADVRISKISNSKEAH